MTTYAKQLGRLAALSIMLFALAAPAQAQPAGAPEDIVMAVPAVALTFSAGYLADDLGLFDNETTKETWKVSQKDTVIGYLQYGRKQKPNRGLSVTVSPEAAQPQINISK